MAVSSFCSHQCSGHSICLTKRSAWVWKRKGICPSATPEISKEYWGWIRAPVVRIRCLICPLEWEITLPLYTKQEIGSMGHYPGCNAAGSGCSVCMCTYVYPHMVIFVKGAGKIDSPCKCMLVANWRCSPYFQLQCDESIYLIIPHQKQCSEANRVTHIISGASKEHFKR